MERFKCYDVAESVIDEATKQFYGMKADPKRKEIVKALCGKIDSFIDAVEADSFSVTVNQTTTEISFCISCPEFEIESNEHPLFAILMYPGTFFARKSEDSEDNVELEFAVPGIWYPN